MPPVDPWSIRAVGRHTNNLLAFKYPNLRIGVFLILLSKHSKLKVNLTAIAKTCNSWRIWGDINDSWASVSSIIDFMARNQDRLIPFAGPGHWNDPDMVIKTKNYN